MYIQFLASETAIPPFLVELAERSIRIFSFAGDTILDPFSGSGSTAVAAVRAGRSSISVEVEKQ
jgi:modification methylase